MTRIEIGIGIKNFCLNRHRNQNKKENWHRSITTHDSNLIVMLALNQSNPKNCAFKSDEILQC